MAIKLTALKCPACGADLQIEEGRKELFCDYCGTKILVTNENEHIYRHIDEAKIKQAETEQMVQMRKLEILDKKRASRAKIHRIKVLISVVLGIIALGGIGISFASGSMSPAGYMVSMVALLILMYMWILTKNDETDPEVALGEKVRVPREIANFEDQDYGTVEALFRRAGFTNVSCVPLGDLRLGLLKKPGRVKSITINGQEVISGGKKYYPGAVVVISYHSIV